ncbi:solute carrier family 2, facilitated glucose transporter member 8-like [Vanessa atalanta]|uniref:solute carrier family 2, facilitated glucose transporter member 8-like n=1 Tax=Vanessa atalanta TaxID=42275 RepID=UPI001FCCE7BD|nr:solute carrier family 2, facilitated glucose transporter member 8-like [Vanessa atalanta]
MHRNRIERTASKRWRGSVRRVVAATVYNLSCFTHGCSTGWVSGVLGNEALTGGAWLAALPCLVALPAAPMFAVLADTRGRRAGALCICLSFIISWSLAAWCGARGVWAARVAAGAGGAGALALAPLYCAEIAPRTRGLAAMPALACSCGILFAYSAGGILSAHALSLSMAIPPIILLLSLIWLPETPSFLISVGKIQEAAKIMCWFDGSDFREDLTDVIEQQEVRIRISEGYGRKEVMRRQDSDTFQPMLKRSSGLESNSDRERAEKSACRELFRHGSHRRALLSCCVVLCAAAGSGAGAVNSFAAAVLRHSAHTVPVLNITAYNFTIYNGTLPRAIFESSEAGSMLCGTALVLGAAVATVTVDKVGRKTLLLWSCTGIVLGLTILGIYCDPHLRMHSWYFHRLWPLRKFNYKEKNIRERIEIQGNFTTYNNTVGQFLNDTGKSWYKVSVEEHNYTSDANWSVKFEQRDKEDIAIWLPVIMLSLVLFLYNVGLGSVPYVLISELFAVNVRSLASSFLIAWMWFSNFLVLRYFGTVAISLGLHAAYYICATITLMSAGYIYLTIPETKGKSQNQITEALEGPWILFRSKRKNER